MEESLEKVRSFIRQNLSVELSLDVTTGRTRRGLQHFSSLKSHDLETRVLYDVVNSYAHQAEKSCPGSGLFLLKMFTSSTVEDSSHQKKDKKSVLKVLRGRNYSRKVSDILAYTVEACNENTKISVKKSSNHKTFIEQIDGYTFHCSPLLKSENANLQSPKVACIDGYIESVSELHMLLTGLSENGQPCLFFCRGMSSDVLHTIKVNNDRKTLSLHPFLVPFDLDNVNTIVDLAVVCGTDVVSTTKGQLISTVTVDKLCSIESATINGSEISIENSSSRERVENHVKNLLKNIEERQELSELLSKRLRSLNTNRLEISLPDDMNFYSDSQQLDEGIRTIMSFISNSYDPHSTSKYFYDKMMTFLKDSHVNCLLCE